MIISIIVAVAESNVIGNKGKLPWHLSEDLKRFKTLTTGHHILMGRKTYESIGRPLPNRTNIILTRDKNYIPVQGGSLHGDYSNPHLIVVHSLADGIEMAIKNGENELFVIGGAKVYELALPLANKMYKTHVKGKFEGDTYFPKIDQSKWRLVNSKSQVSSLGQKFEFQIFEKRTLPNKL